MRVKLERLKNGAALRTSEVLGETGDLPRVDDRFLMTAAPRDPEAGNMQMVLTSPVVAIVNTDFIEGEAWSVVFQTEGSTYRLTRLLGVDCATCETTGFNGQDLTCDCCNGLGWGIWPPGPKS
jgi:hypothetical protein